MIGLIEVFGLRSAPFSCGRCRGSFRPPGAAGNSGNRRGIALLHQETERRSWSFLVTLLRRMRTSFLSATCGRGQKPGPIWRLPTQTCTQGGTNGDTWVASGTNTSRFFRFASRRSDQKMAGYRDRVRQHQYRSRRDYSAHHPVRWPDSVSPNNN
jgi:hypothetical protein